jgi:E1A/CREB-binding protein
MQQQQQQQMQQQQRQVVKMDQINPMAGATSSGNGVDMLRQQSGQYNMASSSRSNPSSRVAPSAPSVPVPPPANVDSEWKIRIRHKQQRLLLLHHSAKCPAENGTCSITPHCSDMKRLWRHMEGCKDNNCKIPHCFSSRAILSHYRKCKDTNCPACGPVRETVRKSSSKSRGGTGSSVLGVPSIRSSANSSHGISSSSTGANNSLMQNPLMNNPSYNNGSSNMPPSQGMMAAMSASPDPIAPALGGASFMTSTANSFHQSQQQPGIHRPHQSSMPPPAAGQPNSSSFGLNPSSGSQYRPSNITGTTQNPVTTQSLQALYSQRKADPLSQTFPSSSRASKELISTAAASNSLAPNGPGGSRNNDTEWQKVRHKQQRLLLLRHASKCQYEAGKCPVTPHCASMKKLWEHIAHCKDQHCTVQHCMSSRYVLSHYRRCKDARCPACGPVRETIRKSHEKETIRQGQNGGPPFPTSTADPFSSLSDIHMPEEPLLPSSPSTSPDLQPQIKKAKIEDPSLSVSNHSDMPVSSTSMMSTAPATASSMGKPSHGQQRSTSPSPTPQAVRSAKTEASSKGKHDDHSLINSFTISEIETHIALLNRAVQLPPVKMKAKCLDVLKGLQVHTHGWVFNTPVDPVELGLPDYFQVIKKPMDLGTVNRRLDNGQYHSIDEFAADVQLTFDNAMQYNEEGSVVHDMAAELKTKFLADYKKLMAQLDAEDRTRRQNDRACTMCGCEKLMFEPPVFFCNGMNCASKRIRRNSHFYIGGKNHYFWCNQCYNELDGNIPIELIDMTIMKDDLKKKKNDEVHEESWVQCDECESWVHQICGLFNTRQNKEHHSKYFCPKCLLSKRKSGEMQQTPRPPSAMELPRTILSECLEKHVHKMLEAKKVEVASLKSREENISIDEAKKKLGYGGPIIIRQVTATERKLEVRERMKKRYAHKNYPDEFPYRCKCLVVFQEMDGLDVVLFALYVYEHGEDSPPPNKRAVYVSYLDSVHFMRPRNLRTFVYHELLICYLDYARNKGFATAHIWACPPLKGDDYIFYAKPEDQKTPRDARLRQWYIDMLAEAQRRGIVGKVTNMYELYFSNEKLDATAVPYMEGDYFPGEAENIIKELEEGNGKKGGSKNKAKKAKSKSKNRAGGRGIGLDEDGLADSDGTKAMEDFVRDEVMEKMGETISPMKDSFIVAFLTWSGATAEQLEVPSSIAQYRLEHPEMQVKLNPTSRKRDADGNAKIDKGVKVIDDDDEDMDCEFLNDRQSFLNLCRGNHYQVDELRRAKHTSMMVLWHLHNRDAPKFVQQCGACNREIVAGMRYHCNTCPEFDLCQDCYKNPKANRGACTHKLTPIAVETNQEGQGGTSGMTEEQRRERQRNLELHIQLIEHASRCKSGSCSSSNCAKMKQYLQHAKTCTTKASGGCKICKRIWTLLRIHAQKCKQSVCPIPQCMNIRERIRQLAKQQQAMDDRRRQAMNGAYRAGLAQV